MKLLERRMLRRTVATLCLIVAGLMLLPSACSFATLSSAKTARVVYFGSAVFPDIYTSFRDGLRQAGWVDGQDLTIEWHLQDGTDTEDLLAGLTADLAQGGPVVLFTDSTAHALALKQATGTVPIVVLIGDPLGTGLVSSLAHPGGNITGLSTSPYGVAGKKIELLRQVLPNVRQLGVLYSDGSYPNLAPLLAEFEIAGTQLGMQVVPVQAPRPEDFDSSLEAFARAGGDVVYPSQDPVTSRNEAEIAAVAIRHGLATLCVRSDWVQQGCLMSYGANRSAYYVHVATHIDRVLRGAQPGDLPIELPTVYDLSVNVKTLQALGVTVPQSALPLVTEWIE